MFFTHFWMFLRSLLCVGSSSTSLPSSPLSIFLFPYILSSSPSMPSHTPSSLLPIIIVIIIATIIINVVVIIIIPTSHCPSSSLPFSPSSSSMFRWVLFGGSSKARNSELSGESWGQHQRCRGSIATLGKSQQHAYWGFEVSGRVRRWCSIPHREGILYLSLRRC